MELVIGILIGLTVGVLSRGVHVTITHKEQGPTQEEVDYNDSIPDTSNKHVVDWLNRNNGTGV